MIVHSVMTYWHSQPCSWSLGTYANTYSNKLQTLKKPKKKQTTRTSKNKMALLALSISQIASPLRQCCWIPRTSYSTVIWSFSLGKFVVYSGLWGCQNPSPSILIFFSECFLSSGCFCISKTRGSRYLLLDKAFYEYHFLQF